MKAKEVTKKLSVNKTTIANLKSKEMMKVNGGFPITSRVSPVPTSPPATQMSVSAPNK